MNRVSGDGQLLRELVAAVAAGDRIAFTELYDLTSSRIYGLAVRIVRDRHYAEEIVQEAFLQYWLNAGDYSPARGSVITWMMTIAHRRAVDRVRVESMQAERISEYGVQSVEPEEPRNLPLEAVMAADEVVALHSCLERLTDLQRGCIEMSYFRGLTYPQVAERLGTPLPTAKSRIRDGLRTLRACMTADDHT
ncbi:sigma-70 family RNA polymerase sigma factor [Gordonia sp. 'Campus']|uniref:sigma-70 family RNA polymerase sigma factor n=1 Tax=Gordonia sp. 'Campus' TaxID=2915824 RepID=UPI001EE3ED60|nr:sigma-70 family RNA polymerase sigma factor [Gordonia sp. 'Campus']